jgi:hypothetical protein
MNVPLVAELSISAPTAGKNSSALVVDDKERMHATTGCMPQTGVLLATPMQGKDLRFRAVKHVSFMSDHILH